MNIIKPRFYDEFRCTAGACSDNCCIGWEIDVDEQTDRAYAAIGGAFGARLRDGIARDGDAPHFRLAEGERCVFLNRDNLCDIQLRLGEGALCAICAEHPRFYEWFGSRVEAGLGLCCEEACRLLLRDPAPLTFIPARDDAPDEKFEGDEALLRRLEREREALFAQVQDRTRPLDARLSAMLARAAALQDELDGFPPAEQPPRIAVPADEALLALCRGLEPIDEGWTRLLVRRGQPADAPDWAMEHAAVYLLYRWFLKAAFDGDALGKARLAAVFVHLARLLLRRGACGSPAEALRALSKEIEYSEENTLAVQAFEGLGV